ncbi:hypothetical protein EON66_02165 [archaeon]|nr:MAG: hypothetical protein EON66_02165 [archaeon]
MNDVFTPAEMNSWYDPCIIERNDYTNGVTAAQDGDTGTVMHSDTYSLNNWMRVDLLIPRMIFNVRIHSRSDHWSNSIRDNGNLVSVGNYRAWSSGGDNIQCSVPPGFVSQTSWRDFSCHGIVGRYVWVYKTDCATTCIMNFAGMHPRRFATGRLQITALCASRLFASPPALILQSWKSTAQRQCFQPSWK